MNSGSGSDISGANSSAFRLIGLTASTSGAIIPPVAARLDTSAILSDIPHTRRRSQHDIPHETSKINCLHRSKEAWEDSEKLSVQRTCLIPQRNISKLLLLRLPIDSNLVWQVASFCVGRMGGKEQRCLQSMSSLLLMRSVRLGLELRMLLWICG